MLAERNPAILVHLRFALEVLEERSHLGLDAEYSEKLSSVIRHQIERGKEALKPPPSLAAPRRAA
jgi:hypothetical protein